MYACMQLVESFRYPRELLELDFKWDYMTKGLIIDRVRWVPYHGLSLFSLQVISWLLTLFTPSKEGLVPAFVRSV